MTPPATHRPQTKPRRVVWVVDALKLGGAERLALRFAAAAPPAWRVEIVALQWPTALVPAPGAAPGVGPLEAIWGAGLEPLAGRIHHLKMRHLGDLAEWLRLCALLRRLRPALLHTHLRYATVWGGAAARCFGIPLVTTVHLAPRPEPTQRQSWAAALERASRRRAARVLYVSEAQRAAWAEVAARETAMVVGNGVSALPAPSPELRSTERRRLGIAEDACVMTTVAVVRARKGWRTWLGAIDTIAARRPEAVFVWVGGGTEFAALAAAVAAHRWAQRIRLVGACPDPARWLALSDLFLFPSEEEAQPTAVMEAMAAGVAVIASALPAIAEVLGGAGRLVPPADAAALAAAALAWSAPGAGERRVEAGEAGRQRIRQHFSEAAWCDRLGEVYAEILDGPWADSACGGIREQPATAG